jgi:hypothetical protein
MSINDIICTVDGNIFTIVARFSTNHNSNSASVGNYRLKVTNNSTIVARNSANVAEIIHVLPGLAKIITQIAQVLVTID